MYVLLLQRHGVRRLVWDLLTFGPEKRSAAVCVGRAAPKTETRSVHGGFLFQQRQPVVRSRTCFCASHPRYFQTIATWSRCFCELCIQRYRFGSLGFLAWGGNSMTVRFRNPCCTMSNGKRNAVDYSIPFSSAHDMCLHMENKVPNG